jgi:hypothetical protein
MLNTTGKMQYMYLEMKWLSNDEQTVMINN